MSRHPAVWPTPTHLLRTTQPDHPVQFFAPATLAATARQFRRGFPGLVTYAVKANDAPEVLDTLVAAGITTFDVASPDEMARARTASRQAVLHYNNPVRSVAEIQAARDFGVTSYSVDDAGELNKIAAHIPPAGIEVAVRLKLPVAGAAYDFGAKFGAPPETCIPLLRQVAALGFRPAMTFHPGTQCPDPAAWALYIRAAGEIANEAGVTLDRLNVGGGFPAQRGPAAPDLAAIFAEIARTTATAFGPPAPALLCEPGRAMVADAGALATRVKSIRADGTVFLNDGIYGGLSEAPILGAVDRLQVLAPDGTLRQGKPTPRTIFGPTCDSLDRLPEPLPLPADLAEGDYVIFHGMGAYATVTATRFNGYGRIVPATVQSLI
ncbi:MAG: type III PLP-dependent enzyme [Pseudomonadota bacterium]